MGIFSNLIFCMVITRSFPSALRSLCALVVFLSFACRLYCYSHCDEHAYVIQCQLRVKRALLQNLHWTTDAQTILSLPLFFLAIIIAIAELECICQETPFTTVYFSKLNRIISYYYKVMEQQNPI